MTSAAGTAQCNKCNRQRNATLHTPPTATCNTTKAGAKEALAEGAGAKDRLGERGWESERLASEQEDPVGEE